MFSFLDYIYEIFTVSAELKVGQEEAFNRFKADVRNGRQTENTEPAIPTFDFAKAKEDYKAAEAADVDLVAEYHDFDSKRDNETFSEYRYRFLEVWYAFMVLTGRKTQEEVDADYAVFAENAERGR
jgi:hypothetical protein